MKTTVCVHADAGVFLSGLLGKADCLRRPGATHYFVYRTENAVHCLARLPEVPSAALRQASGVALIEIYEAP